MENITEIFLKSLAAKESGKTSLETILDWIEELNNSLIVNVSFCDISDGGFWYYDKENGIIKNRNDSFFYIAGIKSRNCQQPIIIQREIGFLGIICKEIDGVLHFLMQGKIEPGNINKVQISPTIQATKSNFTRKHGGGFPPYLEYFLNSEKHTVIVDQIQSEQSSRFYKKRNRNIIIKVEGELEVLKGYKWMTLGQLKCLMKYDNIVNMDARTVLSCIPFIYCGDKSSLKKYFEQKDIYNSLYNDNTNNEIVDIYHYINNYKMFEQWEKKIVPLYELDEWVLRDSGIKCINPYSFSVVYCNIEVEGREVRKWHQPLFKAESVAVFGLIMHRFKNVAKFLVKCIPEVGCFDCIEIGPSIQAEYTGQNKMKDCVSMIFWEKLEKKDGVLFDVLLSEEGGRFYHEQNRNVVLEISEDYIEEVPDCYFWLDLKSLNYLVQINNILNIQLRNLLSVLNY